jgi:hypothetical protein
MDSSERRSIHEQPMNINKNDNESSNYYAVYGMDQ